MSTECDVCGNQDVALRCSACDGKMFCIGCDANWHKHAKRRDHQRSPIKQGQQASTSPPAVRPKSVEAQQVAVLLVLQCKYLRSHIC